MSEKHDDVPGVPPSQGGTTSAPEAPKEAPKFICEVCGPEKPVDAVYKCTACELNYCVKHLAIMAHYCFGALGKSQSIGVSGSS